MSQVNSKKPSSLAVAGVGVAAALASLQNADAAGAASLSQDAVTPVDVAQASAVLVEGQDAVVAQNGVVPEEQHIDALVQNYLGDGMATEALNAEALAADLPDASLEPELLQALASTSGVEVAALGDGGFSEMLAGLGGGSAAMGGALLAGGLVLGGYAINKVTGC